MGLEGGPGKNDRLPDRNWLQGPMVSSLAHVIREFSPKTSSMPVLIHIIPILATLPHLQLPGGGGETLSAALKTFSPWHIPLPGHLLSRRWHYRFCWWMSIAKYAVQSVHVEQGISASLFPGESEAEVRVVRVCVWKTKAHHGSLRRERDRPRLHSPARTTLTFGTSMPFSWVHQRTVQGQKGLRWETKESAGQTSVTQTTLLKHSQGCVGSCTTGLGAFSHSV